MHDSYSFIESHLSFSDFISYVAGLRKASLAAFEDHCDTTKEILFLNDDFCEFKLLKTGIGRQRNI